MVALSIVVLVCIVAVCLWAGRRPHERELLREVYSPSFEQVPPMASIADTIAELRWDLSTRNGQRFIARLLPEQGGVLWITLIVALAVGFDFSRRRSGRNLDLILALLLGLMFFEQMRFFRVRLDPTYWRLLDLVYSIVFGLNAALLLRALWRARPSALVS